MSIVAFWNDDKEQTGKTLASDTKSVNLNNTTSVDFK